MIIRSTLSSHSQIGAFVLPSDRPVRAAPRAWLRNDWLAACTARLSQLRPDQGAPVMASMARALWLDVSAFDPVIAAEMEYETWLAGDPAEEPAVRVPTL